MSKQIKTSELTGSALDWAVAKCEGVVSEVCYDGIAFGFKLDGKLKVLADGWSISYLPSRDWAQGGPILDRQRICIFVRNDGWPDHQRWSARPNTPDGDNEFGPTPLIAAMRCYVASVLGDTVEVPDELLS